jgi:hypothetical protein
LLLALLGTTGALAVDDPDPELVAARRSLSDAGIGTDDAAVLTFFRERLISDEDREKLAATVRQLGHDDFAVREDAEARLLRAGRVALPLLRTAQKDSDPEVASRARRCLLRIEKGSDLVLVAAGARLLAERKPEGAIKTLLDFAPLADDDFVQVAIFQALFSLTVKDDRAEEAIREAAQSKTPARRSAAAFVLSRSGPDDRRLAAKLLQDDEPAVRFQAATGLLRAGVRESVPELVRLLSEAPPQLAYQAEDLLFCIAGDGSPTATLGKADESGRKRAREAWEKWWSSNGDRIDLGRIVFDKALKGLTLVCEHDNSGRDGMGRVWECGRDGKVRWQIDNDMGGPIDARVLTSGRVLVAKYKSRRVTERDREGKILWTHTTDASAVSCQRLANGNTLIGTLTEIVEVTRDNKVVLRIPATNGSIWSAYKGKNGNILYAESGGDVVEVDAAGKRLRAVRSGGMEAWGGAEMLPNGNVLVARYGQGQIVELDWTGKVIWQVNTPNPSYAMRMTNGNTLATNTNNNGIVEFDRDGKEVWKQATQGRPFRTWRY